MSLSNVYRERGPLQADRKLVPQSFTHLGRRLRNPLKIIDSILESVGTRYKARVNMTPEELAFCKQRLPRGVQESSGDIFCLLKRHLCDDEYSSGALIFPGAARDKAESMINQVINHTGKTFQLDDDRKDS